MNNTAIETPIDPRRQAHEDVEASGRAGTQRRRVLDFLGIRGEKGATDYEISAGLLLILDSARSRRNELMNRGLVADSGHRRLTPNGKPAVVWIVGTAAADVPPPELAVPLSPPEIISQEITPAPMEPPRDYCDRCGGELVEIPISGGRARIDCQRCGRFQRWGKWWPASMEEK